MYFTNLQPIVVQLFVVLLYFPLSFLCSALLVHAHFAEFVSQFFAIRAVLFRFGLMVFH